MTVSRACSTLVVLLFGFSSAAAFAHSAGHGGGGHFSGGAHFASGGHFSGRGGAHFAAGAAHAFASPRSFAGVPGFRAAPTRALSQYSGIGRTGVGHVPATVGAPTAPGHPGGAYGLRGRPWGRGYGHPGLWGGGYWGGHYWPGVYYGPGFAWFLPTLPLYCTTFWWLGVPYYYYNDAYYTWSPAADGYVATDPPPVAAGTDAAVPPADVAGAVPAPDGMAAAPDASTATSSNESVATPDDYGTAAPIPPGQFALGRPGTGAYQDHVFAYPSRGQSEQQQSQDRAACDQWAAAQAGGTAGDDFRRALIACFEGRGYSAR